MRRFVTLLVTGLVAVNVGACGHAGPHAPPYIRGDYDIDDEGGVDYDDQYVRTYGRQAASTEEHEVSALVKSYYEAAAADDGARACSMMDRGLAESSNFAKLVPKEYAPGAGASVFSEKGCAQVASLIFEPNRQQLVGDAATVKLASLRVDGTHGLAILIFTTTPERVISVLQEQGVWRINGFLGVPLP